MKQLVLIFGLVMLNLSINAQKKAHVVELQIEEPLTINKFYISDIIDNRIIKSNIGFAQKGLTNRRVPAVLPNSIENYLQQKLGLLIPKGDHSKPITLIIHEFNISERTSAVSERGIFRTQIEFAEKRDQKLYSLWFSELEIEGGGLDVTKKHGNRIITGITECITEFSKTNWNELEGELIELTTNLSFDYKSGAKAGLYSSFSQLAKNEPFLEKDYKFEENKNKNLPKFKVYNNLGKKMNKRIMFVSDGKDIFMHASRYSYDTHFVKSKMIGKYVYFEDRISDQSAAIAFGLIGAALSNTIKGIVLDTETGLVFLLDKKNILKILNPYPELKEKYLKSKQTIDIKKLIIRTINERNQ